jgi:hypothetical protein
MTSGPSAKPCDRLWEIDAVRAGRLSFAEEASALRHRAICTECRERFDSDERLVALGRELTDGEEVDLLRVRRLRAHILREAATATPQRRPWLRIAFVAVPAMAFAAGVALFARHPTPVAPAAAVATFSPAAVPTFAATVTAPDITHWSQRRNGNSEWVDLENGTAFLEVRKQRTDERFFVELPDGEIEVRGTKFEVTVEEHRTIQIHVVEGVVAFIRPNGDEVVLRANESWRRKEPVAIASAPRPVLSPPPRHAEENHAPRDYEVAMAAYRDGDYTAAGERFSQFLVDHPTSREAEDAAFMEANSAAHAGRSDVAAVLAEKFLKRYPDSFHARDAATLVARGAH